MTDTEHRLARFKFDDFAHVWRLRVDAGPGLEQDYVRDVEGFAGNLRNPADMEKIDMFLTALGVSPAEGGWQDIDGGWVTPIVKRGD